MPRRKLIVAVTILTAFFVGWLAVSEAQDRMNKQRAYLIIRELGGAFGSITPPVPFSGSEIIIEFHSPQFKKGDLNRLAVLQPVTSRNHVSLVFRDGNITRHDIIELRAMLPDCEIYRYANGERQDDK